MIKNLTGQQILLIITGIIVLLWLINWFFMDSKSTKTKSATIQPTVQPIQPIQPLVQYIKPSQHTQLIHTQAPNTPIISPTGPEIPHQGATFTLYYFYSPACGYCKQFWPSWNAVANKLKEIHGIFTKTIDATKPENENLTFYYNITGYPTVILSTPEKDVEYTGNRTSDELYKFVIWHIDEYKTNQTSANNQNIQNMYSIQNNQYIPTN